jgi:hypothetical protein
MDPPLAHGTAFSSWLSIHTQSVISAFLRPLSKHPQWRLMYIISPWISPFDSKAGLSFDDMIRRITICQTPTFVATRPPEHDWHLEAVRRLADTNRASIALIPSLHTKLFCAETTTATIAMFGSANLTSRALDNIEFGAVILGQGLGEPLCRRMFQHAAEIYRLKDRTLFCKGNLKPSSPLTEPTTP